MAPESAGSAVTAIATSIIRSAGLALAAGVVVAGLVVVGLGSEEAAWGMFVAGPALAAVLMAALCVSEHRPAERRALWTITLGVTIVAAAILGGKQFHLFPHAVCQVAMLFGRLVIVAGSMAWLVPRRSNRWDLLIFGLGVPAIAAIVLLAGLSGPLAAAAAVMLRLASDAMIVTVAVMCSRVSVRAGAAVALFTYAAALTSVADLLLVVDPARGDLPSIAAIACLVASMALIPAAILHARANPTAYTPGPEAGAAPYRLLGFGAACAAVIVVDEGRGSTAVDLARVVFVTALVAGIIVWMEFTIRGAQRRQLREQLRAMVNPGSGLRNRAGLDADVRAAALGDAGVVPPGALAVVRIEGLEMVRALYGRPLHGQVENEVRDRLTGYLTDGEPLYHVDIDRFVVLLDCADTAVERSRGIAELFRRSVRASDTEFALTAVVGIAEGVVDEVDTDRLVEEAQLAGVLAARSDAPVVVFGDERDSVDERMRMLGMLRNASSDGSLELHYQPVIDTSTGGVAALEALVRWRVNGNLMRPGYFLQLAETSGLIVEIGRWVLETALVDIARLRAGNPRFAHTAVSVNFSGVQVQRSDFARGVLELLEANALPPEALWLELTETTLIADTERARRTLSPLADRGVRVTLDDFGVGYSALSNLTDFPISIVKLDRSFTETLVPPGKPEISARGTVARSVVAMVSELGIAVVAEGVETEDVYRGAVACGCHYSQGWYHALPSPISHFLTGR